MTILGGMGSLNWKLKKAEKVKTAPLVATGLIGGWLVARETGIRPLGGIPLALAGIYSGRTWYEKKGPGVTGILEGIYLGAFGASHPLAKKIGSWPAVLAVTAVSAASAYALSDKD